VTEPGLPPRRDGGSNNIKAVAEIKFPNDVQHRDVPEDGIPIDRYDRQIRAQERIAGGMDKHFKLDVKSCSCREKRKKEKEQAEPSVNAGEILGQLILRLLMRLMRVPPIPMPLPPGSPPGAPPVPVA
jgi:hypothetical protein